MGREVRRVPEGFEFPAWETWPGCIGNPPYPPPDECETCGGTGMPPVTRALMESFYTHQVGEVAAWGNHLVEADLESLRAAGRPVEEPLDVDAIDRWIMAKDRARRIGAAEVDACPACEGHGDHDPEREQREAWVDAWNPEYPTGPWFQLWQTVSEGGPVSPSFETAEQLAVWMSTHKATVMGSVPYDDALRWINGPGWAPSMILTPSGLSDGIGGAS